MSQSSWWSHWGQPAIWSDCCRGGVAARMPSGEQLGWIPICLQPTPGWLPGFAGYQRALRAAAVQGPGQCSILLKQFYSRVQDKREIDTVVEGPLVLCGQFVLAFEDS